MQGLIIENIANLYKIENKEKNNQEVYEAYAREFDTFESLKLM